MVKNFKDINDTPIDDTNLSRLHFHISGPGYLKKRVSRFTEVITEDKGREITEEPEVFDSKEEKKK